MNLILFNEDFSSVFVCKDITLKYLDDDQKDGKIPHMKQAFKLPKEIGYELVFTVAPGDITQIGATKKKYCDEIKEELLKFIKEGKFK